MPTSPELETNTRALNAASYHETGYKRLLELRNVLRPAVLLQLLGMRMPL